MHEKKRKLVLSGKGSYFLNMTLVHLYKGEVQCYWRFQRLLRLLRKIVVFHTQDAKKQDNHLLKLCILWMYLSWMCYLLPKGWKGGETTRCVMNWFTVKVSSVLLNYSVSHPFETGSCWHKWLSLQEHDVAFFLVLTDIPGSLVSYLEYWTLGTFFLGTTDLWRLLVFSWSFS